MFTQEIKNKLNELYQNTPDYVGVAYGHKTIKGVETSDKSIVFTVPKKIPLNEIPFNERLPEFVEISGTIYRTDVLEIGKVIPMVDSVVCNNPLINPSCYTWSPLGSISPPNRNSLRPLVGGISLTAGHLLGKVGTLGLIVVDSSSQKLVGLTNNHVVVQDASYTSYRDLLLLTQIVNEYKYPAYQNGESSTPSISQVIGEVIRYVPLKSQPESNTVDCALVSLCANTVSNTTSFTQLGINYNQPMPFATTAEINSLLATPRTILSSGRTSGVKSGDCGLKIKLLGAFQDVGSYPLQGVPREVLFNDLIVFTRLSESCNFPIYGGDSGSVLIADFDGVYKIIGLNFAGSSQVPGSTTDIGQFGYACRIDNVAFELGIEAWDGTPKNTVSTIEKVITPGGSPNKTIIVDGKTYWQVGLSPYLN